MLTGVTVQSMIKRPNMLLLISCFTFVLVVESVQETICTDIINSKQCVADAECEKKYCQITETNATQHVNSEKYIYESKYAINNLMFLHKTMNQTVTHIKQSSVFFCFQTQKNSNLFHKTQKNTYKKTHTKKISKKIKKELGICVSNKLR